MKKVKIRDKEFLLEIVAISLAMVLVFTFGFGMAQTVKSVRGIETFLDETKPNGPVDYTLESIDPDNTTNPGQSVTNQQGGSNYYPGNSGQNGNTIDPTGYSKAELIAYFNTAANRVRSERPGFKYIDRSSVTDTYFAGLKGAWIDSIVNSSFKDIDATVKKGQPSAPSGDPVATSYFGSEQPAWAAKLRPEDVISCSCSKSGNNYIVKLRLISEINPETNGNSAYSRCLLVLTKRDVQKQAEPNGLTIQSLDDLTLSYHDGYITATIDPQGRIIDMKSGFIVDGVGNNVSFNLINGSGTIKMTITKTYKQVDFVW